ncbi:hypothetical protein ACHAWF_007379 [Thalassiosira exigua]
MVRPAPAHGVACLLASASAFSLRAPPRAASSDARPSASSSTSRLPASNPLRDGALALLSASLLAAPLVAVAPSPAFAADTGASTAANSKITTGGASTLQSGRTIAITRGVNLDRSDFKGQNLKGVAFQQSIVRDTDFRGANLYGASFFDATVDGSDFEGADMSLCNIEMAQFNRANLKVREVVRESFGLSVARFAAP